MAAKKQTRNAKKRRTKARRQPHLDRGLPIPRDFTVAEWCAKRRISRVHFYALLKLGLGPRTMKLGKRRTITPAADAEWEAAREAAAAEAKAAAATTT